ncbi:flagellar hook-associated family protein [Cognatishimia sp. WU-CL00825]|uniref:flagellin n=1 Tax=Cognatishimia sp. WU-CL00825 TaxID=3127658 RepID=UPI00310B50E3
MTWLANITRMSTMQLNQSQRSNVSTAQIALQRAGHELATGKRADLFGDMGSRAAIAFSMRTLEDNTQAYMLSNKLLDNKLQTMLDSIDGIRESVSDVTTTALLSKDEKSNSTFVLQTQARAAIEAILGGLNGSYNGEFMFGGTASNTPPLNRWSEANAATGLSPEDVLSAVVGTGPTTAAEAASMAAELDQIFASSHSGNPNYNFEATFYNGTPELDGSAQPNNRVVARVSQGQQLDYGVQANDQGIRDLLKGLSMLASVDVNAITDEAAYTAWMTTATDALAAGTQGMLDISSSIGFDQQIVERANDRLSDLSILQRTQIATIEDADPYEAATRVSNMETQLQASYTVSARLSGLSILNYLR